MKGDIQIFDLMSPSKLFRPWDYTSFSFYSGLCSFIEITSAYSKFIPIFFNSSRILLF